MACKKCPSQWDIMGMDKRRKAAATIAYDEGSPTQQLTELTTTLK